MKIDILKIYDSNGEYVQTQATLRLSSGRCIFGVGRSTQEAIGSCVEQAWIDDTGDFEIGVKRSAA